MKVDLTAVIRDYGFGSWTVVLSAVNAEDGTPVTDLTDKSITVMAVQSPNGWATSDVLKINSGLHLPTEGVYVFSAGLPGNKKLSAGPYTLAITVKKKGVNGQTLASGHIG